MTKNYLNCTLCEYWIDNCVCREQDDCTKCIMRVENADENSPILCKCNTIKEEEDCPYFKEVTTDDFRI